MSWLLEVHVDRRWYERRLSPEPIPAPGRPRVVALELAPGATGLLVGRSGGLEAVDVDLRPDNGVSRRHALLQFDREHWWVTDLGSNNGTWVSPDVSRLPQKAITERTRLADGSCVFLGGWTRLVVRQAAPAANAPGRWPGALG